MFDKDQVRFSLIQMPKAERNAKLNGQIILIVLTGKTNRTGAAVPNLVSQDRDTTATQLSFIIWKIRKIYYTLLVYISWIHEHQAVTVARRSYSANEPKLYCTKLNIVFRVWCLIAQCGNWRFLNLCYKWVYMSYRWTPVVLIELHNSLLGEEYKDTTI